MATSSATRVAPAHSNPIPILVDGRLRCPRCHTIKPILSYFSFDRAPEHEDELNVVYKCRARVDKGGGHVEPCRYVFSPGLTTAELSAAIRPEPQEHANAA